MNREKRILVEIPTINHPERLKLEGLLVYAHEKPGPRWDIRLELGSDIRCNPRDYDGVIAYVTSERDRKTLLKSKIPVVLIEDVLPPKHFSKSRNVVTILSDHEAVGRTAAEYFLERHFRHFAWIGPEEESSWSTARKKGFRAKLREAGFACDEYSSDDMAGLAEFLERLAKPAAVFAVHDFRARDVLAAARKARIAVPEDIAVLGVDNDVPICETCSPALSSIPTDDHALGYNAGRIMNELLLGRSPGEHVVKIPHRHVVSRFSTDADALSDPFVARTLAWARMHLDDKLDSMTLARRVGYSKRMLQLRVEKALGIPLGEEIRRLRTRAALEMLSDGNMPVTDIAAACGFSNVSHLVLRVRAATGLTPLAYRRRKNA